MIKYFSIFIMSIGALSISFGAGFKYYEQYVCPCVYNLSTKAFEKNHQEILEDNTPYDKNIELGQKFTSPSDMAKSLNGGIYVNQVTLEKNM